MDHQDRFKSGQRVWRFGNGMYGPCLERVIIEKALYPRGFWYQWDVRDSYVTCGSSLFEHKEDLLKAATDYTNVQFRKANEMKDKANKLRIEIEDLRNDRKEDLGGV